MNHSNPGASPRTPDPTPAPAAPAAPVSAQPAGKPPDLRRRGRRELVAAIISRAPHLPPDEAALLRTVYESGQPAVSMSTLMGVRAPAVRRRLRRLTRRILSERFQFVVYNRARWTPAMRRVAVACYLHGKTVRRASADLHMSQHRVRRYRDAIEALFEASRL